MWTIDSLRLGFFRGVPFSLYESFVTKEGFLSTRFLLDLRPLDRLVVLWLLGFTFIYLRSEFNNNIQSYTENQVQTAGKYKIQNVLFQWIDCLKKSCEFYQLEATRGWIMMKKDKMLPNSLLGLN